MLLYATKVQATCSRKRKLTQERQAGRKGKGRERVDRLEDRWVVRS